MHVLDLFNDKDRNFLNGGSAVSEGGMPDLNLEYQDYLKLPPMAFQSRYKMSKEQWAEKYKNLLPKPAPVDPLAGMPEAPLEEGDVIPMPARPRTATPQATPADVIPMIKDRTNRAYEMWKQRILRANSNSAGKIKFYSKGNNIVAQIPSMAEPLGTFNIDTYTGNVLNEVDPNNFDSDWDYQDALEKSGKPRSSYPRPQDDTFDDDVAYSRKMYKLSQQQKAAKDNNQGVAEGSQRVDSLVTDVLKIMRGPTMDDAIAALKTVLGDREYNSRRGHYNFYVRQILDMYGQQGVAEGFSNDMSTEDMIAYLRQHHDKNLHPDYLNHLTNTNSKFVLKNILLTSIRTELSGLDRAKVEQYKKMDFSKAPPIVVGSDGNILDGYHRANVAKALGISTVKAYVGIKSQQGVAEGQQNSIVINGKQVDITSLEVDGVDPRDYPDFSDAYFSSGYFVDGTPLSDEELNQLADTHGDLLYDKAYDSLHEGWLKNTVAGVAIAGAALGAQARVTPDGQGGYTGGLKPTPTATQPAASTTPARIDSPSSPSGFSKEYLQKASDPNRTGRYMISVEKAQQLLKQMQEAVAEGNSGAKYKMVCKDCGDVFNKPTTNCRHDSHNPNGPNWIKKNKSVAEGGSVGIRTWSGQVRLAHGKDVKFYNRKNDTIDRVVAMKGQKLVGIFDRATDKGRVIDEDISRRGFLKGAGAAAVAGIGTNSQAQPDQQQDLGNSFVTATATIDGVTYRAIQDTISKSGYMLNHRGDGTPIVNRPGEFLVVRNGKIEARMELAPNVIRALQKAGILTIDDSQVQTQTSPAVTHSSRGGTNQPAVTHSSRGGTNQPAVTYSAGSKRMRNEETASRMKMDDYLKAAEDLQNKLTQAIKLGDKELIQQLSKQRDELDAQGRKGMIPEVMHKGDMQSLVTSYKNLIKRAIAIIFGRKQPTNDPAAFQRMMSKIVAPADSSRHKALWQEYKNDKHYYVPTPHPFKDINNKEKMYLWANSLSQFVSDKYPNAPIETLVHLVAGLTEIAAKEAIKQSRSGLDEASQQKPRVRKYTKMRPDGSKAVRYEVLDHMGRRITGQGPEGFDDLKLAKDFYYKNYDRLASLDETADGNVTDTVKMDVPLLIRIMEFAREDAKTDMDLHNIAERLIELGKTGDTLTMQDYQDAVASLSAPEMSDTPTEPVMKEAGGRYWCSTEKRWKDR